MISNGINLKAAGRVLRHRIPTGFREDRPTTCPKCFFFFLATLLLASPVHTHAHRHRFSGFFTIPQPKRRRRKGYKNLNKGKHFRPKLKHSFAYLGEWLRFRLLQTITNHESPTNDGAYMEAACKSEFNGLLQRYLFLSTLATVCKKLRGYEECDFAGTGGSLAGCDCRIRVRCFMCK